MSHKKTKVDLDLTQSPTHQHLKPDAQARRIIVGSEEEKQQDPYNLLPENNGPVYLSGPMSGLPDHNFPAFNAAAKSLRDSGYHVISPAEYQDKDETLANLGHRAWSYYFRKDLLLLAPCSMLALLPGWENSKGARLEVVVARELWMPIMDAETLEPVNIDMLDRYAPRLTWNDPPKEYRGKDHIPTNDWFHEVFEKAFPSTGVIEPNVSPEKYTTEIHVSAFYADPPLRQNLQSIYVKRVENHGGYYKVVGTRRFNTGNYRFTEAANYVMELTQQINADRILCELSTGEVMIESLRAALGKVVNRITELPPAEEADDCEFSIHPPSEVMSPKESVAQEAMRLVGGDRNVDYGHPYYDFARTAKIITGVLLHKLIPGVEVLPHEIPHVMQGFKISRAQHKPDKRDNPVDGIGYWICYDRVIDKTLEIHGPDYFQEQERRDQDSKAKYQESVGH